MIPMPEFWRAVARGIDAEEEKASIFIKHNPSRGVARESILRNLLVSHTPEPFRVETGFICNMPSSPALSDTCELWLSRQCDVLVYNPQVARPYYAIDKLSVVPRQAASMVIEVKTNLDKATFQQILDVWETTWWLPVPTFGFAYEGVDFKTFLQYLESAIKGSQCGVPECIAVHRQNYIGLRSPYRLVAPSPDRHRPAKYQFVIDFGLSKEALGKATAVFLDSYLRWLYWPRDDVEAYLPSWFNNLQLPDRAMARIDDIGNIVFGPIRDE